MQGPGPASRRSWAAAFLLGLVLAAPAARGAEFSVHSETVGQAYRIRGRDGLFIVPRSRVTQLLFLYGTDLLGLSEDALGPKDLEIVLNFQLDHDFAVEPASLDPNDEASFIPLLRRTQVGLLSGHLSGRFGLDPAFRFGAGRLVLLDPAGFLALDGVDLDLAVAGILSVGLAAGFEIVPDIRLSVADFSPEGVAWGRRDGYPSDVHPEVRSPRPRPVIATSIGVAIPGGGSLVLSYRRTWEDLSMKHVALELLGLGIDVSGWDRPVSVRIRSSFDLAWLRMSEVDAEVRILPHPAVGLGMRLLHIVPLFDTASIFNVFDVDPHDEVGLFVSLGRPAESVLDLSAAGFVRLTDVSGYEAGGDDRFSDLGGSVAIHLDAGLLDLAWAARGSGGESGVLAGTQVQSSFEILSGRLVPVAGVGLWFWEDPLRREHDGLTVGGSALVRWKIARPVLVVAGLDVFHNRVSGTSLTGTVRIAVEI